LFIIIVGRRSSHYAYAVNNAIEIRAVVKALRRLPEGMYMWISTDSAYVQNGITQWMGNWIKNDWKTSDGKRVANKSFWHK
jgi:ribonuclease HI